MITCNGEGVNNHPPPWMRARTYWMHYWMSWMNCLRRTHTHWHTSLQSQSHHPPRHHHHNVSPKAVPGGSRGEPNGAVAGQRERSKHEVPGGSQNNSVTHPTTNHKQRYTCSCLELTHQHSHWRGPSHTTQKIQGTGGYLGGSRRRGRSHLH